MATYSKITLSGSTDGKGIAVAATSSPGTTIHTGSGTATTYDEVWLYAINQSAGDIKLTVEWGAATTADIIEQTITTEAGLTLIAPGLLVKGNGTPLVVKAFGGSAGINIFGYVNQITA
nr:hypothetical protein [uncultured Mediterranean phage uvMED]|tara:strand:- start:2227 stop:2583 length:357 start_codon:yes stop_codon:yes gene_type:complete